MRVNIIIPFNLSTSDPEISRSSIQDVMTLHKFDSLGLQPNSVLGVFGEDEDFGLLVKMPDIALSEESMVGMPDFFLRMAILPPETMRYAVRCSW